MLFEDKTNEWKRMSPPPRRGYLSRHPAALVALLALAVAGGAALVGLGTLYASELEPCLRTDGGTFGNCGDATGAFVVAAVVGIPALVWLLVIAVRHRHSESGPPATP